VWLFFFDILRRNLTIYVEKKKSGLEKQNMPNSVSPTHHGYSPVRQVTVVFIYSLCLYEVMCVNIYRAGFQQGI
jgi:hypothetical protein